MERSRAGCLFFSCHLLGEFCPGWLVNVRANKGAGGERVGCIESERRWSRQGECEVQQSHHEASVPGPEPGACLSTGKLFCCFC